MPWDTKRRRRETTRIKIETKDSLLSLEDTSACDRLGKKSKNPRLEAGERNLMT
jgi:hypothetical protein